MPIYQKTTVCHCCGEIGHRATWCQEPKIDRDALNEIIQRTQYGGGNNERVVCFSCSEHGHYATLCPKRKDKIP